MPWLSEEQIAAARRVDLLTYLQEREPHELVRSAPGEYRTVSHGSLVISNGAWYWNRGQFGGVSALDYLTKVQGVGLVAAVEMINGIRCPTISSPLPVERQQSQPKKWTFYPPKPQRYGNLAVSYLQQRGISPEVIRRMMQADIFYESRYYNPKSKYHNAAVCVFVGKDESGKAVFAALRGIDTDLKIDKAGSNKRFGFCLPANDPTNGTLVVLESPIDALSHLCLYPGIDAHRLSLGGTSDVALLSFLERNPQIDHVSLCLYADVAGQTAAKNIEKVLAGDARFAHIKVSIDPPSIGKDYNEVLLHTVSRQRERTPPGHRKDAGFLH